MSIEMKEYGSQASIESVLDSMTPMVQSIGLPELALSYRSNYSYKQSLAKQLAAITINNQKTMLDAYETSSNKHEIAAGFSCAHHMHPSKKFADTLFRAYPSHVVTEAITGSSWHMGILGQVLSDYRSNSNITMQEIEKSLQVTDVQHIHPDFNTFLAPLPKDRTWYCLHCIADPIYRSLGVDPKNIDRMYNNKYIAHSVALLRDSLTSMISLTQLNPSLFVQFKESCGIVNYGKTDIETMVYADRSIRTIDKHAFSILYITPSTHADIRATVASSVRQQVIEAQQSGSDAEFYYYEFADADDFREVLLKIKNNTTKHVLVVADGHGTHHSFGDLSTQTLVELFRQIGSVKTTVLFNSCSTGVKANGLAKSLSPYVYEVAGPNIPTHATAINLTFLQDEIFNTIHFHKGTTNRFNNPKKY